MRKKRRKARRKKILSVLIPVVILVVALFAVMVWKVFVVRDVEVVGNEIYADEQIKDWVLDDEYSWNSLYVVLKNKLTKQEEIPFVDTINISFLSPSRLQLEVVEKGVIGYVFIPTLGENAYFDQDGFVVELSTDIIEGTIKITGLSVTEAVLYEKLDIEDSSILKTLLNLTLLLKKYEREPELIYVMDTQLILSYGDIQVNVGAGTSLNEKILRMDEILGRLDGMTGTLHLDTWSESNTDIYFKKNELVTLPVDEQIISTGETESAEDTDDEEETASEEAADAADDAKEAETDAAEEDMDLMLIM